MRIIVVNDYGYVNGGASQVALSSLNALADAGHEVVFVSSVQPVDKSIDPKKVEIVNFGFEDLLNNPSKLNAAINGLWDFRCAKLFGVILDKCTPDNTIVHFHSWTKSLSASVIREALSRKYNVVVTLHDYFSVCPNGGLFDYVNRKHCKVKPMSIACAFTNCDARSYSQKLWRFFRQILQIKFSGMPIGVINFISISDYSENILRKHLPGTVKIFRVPNPIDIVGKPKPPEVASKQYLFVGRLSPEKGPSIFAKAANKANVKAVFIGDGSEHELIKKINPDAEIHGWRNRDFIIEQMRSSRAVVFPSLWHESQGLVVSEASALGIPSIVSDGCAARDSIINGETGLLFSSGNINSLIKAIKKLNLDDKFALELGKAAYNRFWDKPPTLENHVNELTKCYKQILINRSKGA
jgi:glycosyltransferase involved in cell wall biosynthesis